MATKKIETLHDLLLVKLQALYDVENQLIKALPKMAKAATDKKLKAAFTEHLEETKGHAEKLEKIFDLFELKPGKITSEAIRGLVKDGDWVAKNVKDADARDAGLIAAAQYVEHYEMAGYGTAKEWADVMGHIEAGNILSVILEEESMANEKLTDLATSGINERSNNM